MPTEYNPVETATATPGQMSALDYNLGGAGGGFNAPNNQIDLTSTDLSNLGTTDLFGGQQQYGSSTPSTDFSNVGGGDLSSVGSATGVPSTSTPDLSALYSGQDGTGTTPVAATGGNVPAAGGGGSQGGSWWQNFLGGLGTVGSGVGSLLTGKVGQLAGLGGIGAYGLSQAKDAQKLNDARAKQLADLGGPYTAAGQALLKQFQSGQIRPDQQAVTNLATSQGDTLIQSGQGLSQIAQSAYQNYQSGTLPAADEQRLSQQVAAQKQELRARLGNITDSSILAGYDQQIENQAQITRQDLLDKRFATGNQAYDEWLKSTTEGQQMKLQGQEYAAKSLDNMLNQSLSLNAEGMSAVSESIQLAIQSDTQLSQQVNELMGNLASAFAYTMAGGSGGGTGGGQAGGGQGGVGSSLGQIGKGIGQILGQGGVGSAIGKGIGKLGGGSSGSTQPGTYDPSTSDFTGAPGQTSVDWTGQTTGNDAWSQGTPTWNLPGATTDSSAGFTGDPGQTSVDWAGSSTGTDVPTFDTSNPSGAGGQAATSPVPSSGGFNTGAALSNVGAAAGLYQGLQKGGVAGYGTAAADAAKLAASSGLLSKNAAGALKGYGAGLGNVLGIYGGLKQGGVAGDTGAAVNAAQLGARAGAFGGASSAVGTAAGYAAIPLALYSEIESWQSGKTGQDALGGASTGAAIGTAVMPGIGTAVGAVIGAAAGAISSLFGGGAVDPENAPFESYTQAYNKAPANQKQQVAAAVKNPYISLAGYFDLRKEQMKGSNPIYDRYGRMGEEKFTNDLIGKVQQGQQSGIKDSTQMWNQVVQPWINSMGTWQDSNKDAMTALMQNMTAQITAGTYSQNFQAIGGDNPFASSTATPGAVSGGNSRQNLLGVLHGHLA